EMAGLGDVVVLRDGDVDEHAGSESDESEGGVVMQAAAALPQARARRVAAVAATPSRAAAAAAASAAAAATMAPTASGGTAAAAEAPAEFNVQPNTATPGAPWTASHSQRCGSWHGHTAAQFCGACEWHSSRHCRSFCCTARRSVRWSARSHAVPRSRVRRAYR
ncbi:MAG: hypothetical protein ACK4MS_16545, partial [Paracoccaceae bacterium]